MEKLASFYHFNIWVLNEIVLTVNTDNPHAITLARQGYQYIGNHINQKLGILWR